MKVTVNGVEREVKEGETVRMLVEAMGMANQAVAAEVNKTLVPRRRQEETVLKEGDAVELVSLVGGG
jgi:sulfur carrier protein